MFLPLNHCNPATIRDPATLLPALGRKTNAWPERHPDRFPTMPSYIVHWNTKRRQARLEGRTPEEFRNTFPTA